MVPLLDLSFRAALLALAAAAILYTARIRSAACRHLVWTVVLISMLLMPAWSAWGPDVAIPVPSSAGAVKAPITWQFAAPAPGMAPSAGSGVGTVARSSGGAAPGIPWNRLALTLYGAGVALFLFRLLFGTVRTRQLLRRAVSKDGYFTSDACAAPITAGWLRPVVLLPRASERWPDRQLRAVLIHEQEHARRRDPLVQWLSLVNRAVFWFHPLAWWLERHLAALSEQACDAAVLSRGHSPDEYAAYLLDISRAVTGSGRRVRLVGTALPGTSMAARIRQILQEQPQRRDSHARFAAAVALCAFSSVAIVAGTLQPTEDSAIAPPPQRTQRDAGSRDGTLPEFWFDEDEWHREVAPIATAEEAAAYAQLRTAGQRESFIEEFWRRRDTAPATPENEFRQEFERRITYAREQLANPTSYAVPGYETDRGRFYVAWGPPASVTVSEPVEEWHYSKVPSMGGDDVTIRFDPSADFGCSVRGGRYRFLAPAPLARFESPATGSAAHPVALVYPGRFVHLSFPIHRDAAGIQFAMRAAAGAQPHPGEIRGPVDYIQGRVHDTRRNGVAEPILALVARAGTARFFEPGSFACTEQLPADTYTLTIDTTLADGSARIEQLTFVME